MASPTSAAGRAYDAPAEALLEHGAAATPFAQAQVQAAAAAAALELAPCTVEVSEVHQCSGHAVCNNCAPHAADTRWPFTLQARAEPQAQPSARRRPARARQTNVPPAVSALELTGAQLRLRGLNCRHGISAQGTLLLRQRAGSRARRVLVSAARRAHTNLWCGAHSRAGKGARGLPGERRAPPQGRRRHRGRRQRRRRRRCRSR
jgi:hypothetical protein